MAVSAVLPFTELISNQSEMLSALSKKGRKSIGYFCHYTPVELIHAAGFIPVRISGGPGNVENAYNLAPDFICPYMKRSLEKAMAGEYQFLSGLVQGYTCDIACGMANIWAENIDGELFHILPLPYEDSENAHRYLISEYENLIGKLSEMGGSYSDSNLQMRTEGRLPLNSSELWQVVQAGVVSIPEVYVEMLEDLLEGLGNISPSNQSGVPVLVSGSLIEDPKIFDFIEKCGGHVVSDDLCSGLRSVSSDAGFLENPLAQLAALHFSRSPCPSRSRAEDRFPVMMDLITKSGAKGVVFMFQKFCTPHLSDYPFLSKRLQESNVPSVMIEIEENWQADAQTGTRLEGLFEIIGD